MNLIQFVAGSSYYGALSFCVMEFFQVDSPDVFQSVDMFHVIAIVVFFYANALQYRTHKYFAECRNGDPGSWNYVVPTGGWFELISCPHYFAEVVIYSSFVILTKAQNLSLVLAWIFVATNIFHSALRTHNWYHSKFPNYPKSRKAILPWIL